MTMTVNEAIAKTQKKRVGLVNKISVKYAQTLLLEDEKPKNSLTKKRSNYRKKLLWILTPMTSTTRH